MPAVFPAYSATINAAVCAAFVVPKLAAFESAQHAALRSAQYTAKYATKRTAIVPTVFPAFGAANHAADVPALQSAQCTAL